MDFITLWYRQLSMWTLLCPMHWISILLSSFLILSITCGPPTSASPICLIIHFLFLWLLIAPSHQVRHLEIHTVLLFTYLVFILSMGLATFPLMHHPLSDFAQAFPSYRHQSLSLPCIDLCQTLVSEKVSHYRLYLVVSSAPNNKESFLWLSTILFF